MLVREDIAFSVNIRIDSLGKPLVYKPLSKGRCFICKSHTSERVFVPKDVCVGFFRWNEVTYFYSRGPSGSSVPYVGYGDVDRFFVRLLEESRYMRGLDKELVMLGDDLIDQVGTLWDRHNIPKPLNGFLKRSFSNGE